MSAVAKTKGELTAERILDAGEQAFASRGYGGVSLREIAREAGIREPGLYNYFRNKEHLYQSVLERGLQPLADTLQQHLNTTEGIRVFTELPVIMTDLLLEHPKMAALFQQALLGDSDLCERFRAKGRMREYLSAIPLRLITAENIALEGAARLYEQQFA